MTLGGAGRRRKGARFELKVAAALRLLWERTVRGRGQSRDTEESDIEGLPIRAECKKRSSWPNIGQAMAQVWRDAKTHSDPRPVCVISAKDHEEPVVSFEIRQFIKFVEEERARVRSSQNDREKLIAFLDRILLDPRASKLVDDTRTTDVLRQLRAGILEGRHLDA